MSRAIVVVFAPPPREPDDALLRTRWMAERTMERLSSEDIATVAVVDDQATRDGLEGSITEDVAGVALFSHGAVAKVVTPAAVEDAIAGSDGPALDDSNLHLLRGRWGHAVACHSGTELAARACEQGAECFVGYEISLRVDWNPDHMPGDLVELMSALVTETTSNLAAGMRGEEQLRSAVARIAKRITKWCKINRADSLALQTTANQLVERLVYRARLR